MYKMITAVLVTLFLLIYPAARNVSAFSPGDTMSAPHPATDPSKGLLVTLEVPRDSHFLEGVPLIGITKANKDKNGASITLEVPVDAEAYASLPLAKIGEEPLTLGLYLQTIQRTENEEGEPVSVAGQDPMQVLNRLVDSQMMVHEGREIGIDELSKVVDKVKVYSLWLLRDMLIQEQLAEVKVNPEMVEDLYREGATEFRLKAVLFSKENEQDAKDFLKQLEEGRDFDELAEVYSEKDKTEIKVGGERNFIQRKDMQLVMATALDKLEPGQTSSIIPAGENFTIVKLLEKRLPEDPHIRAQAEEMARNYASNKKLEEYNESLMEKYVTVHKDVFDSLDEVNDIEALLKDERILADIKGGKPITVAELADALRVKYFHGIDRAIEEGRFANDKALVFSEKLFKRVLYQEGVARGFDKRPDYLVKLKNYEDGLIFGAFMEKAVVPDIKIDDQDLQNYYDEHISDFSSPEMVGLRGLTFYDADKAQRALTSLQKGTDLRWLQANAEGQVPPGTEGLLALDGGLVTTPSLPEGMVAALEGATPGQYRLYSDGEKFYYVLLLERKIPATVQPLDSVKREVIKAVFNRKTGEALDDWIKKLRKAYDVEIYATGFNKQNL